MTDDNSQKIEPQTSSMDDSASGKQEQPDSDPDKVISLLGNESDRGAVLVGLALLDSEVEGLLRVKFAVASARYIESLDFEQYEGDLANLIELHQRARKNLLTYPGALSSVASKLDLAFSMGWLSEDCYHDLVQIRKLRNRAAHTTDPVDLFGDPHTQKLLTSLRTVSNHLMRKAMTHPATYRAAFSWVIATLCTRICNFTKDEYEIAAELCARNKSKARSAVGNLGSTIEALRTIQLKSQKSTEHYPQSPDE